MLVTARMGGSWWLTSALVLPWLRKEVDINIGLGPAPGELGQLEPPATLVIIRSAAASILIPAARVSQADLVHLDRSGVGSGPVPTRAEQALGGLVPEFTCQGFVLPFLKPLVRTGLNDVSDAKADGSLVAGGDHPLVDTRRGLGAEDGCEMAAIPGVEDIAGVGEEESRQLQERLDCLVVRTGLGPPSRAVR